MTQAIVPDTKGVVAPDILSLELERQRTAAERLSKVIAALNVFHAKHGFLSDEFPSF